MTRGVGAEVIDEDEDQDYDEEASWDEEWGTRRDTTLWWRRDSMSRGRWLYVEQPDDEGDVPVGIERVYEKWLTPDEADEMAAALIESARQGRIRRAEREEARKRRNELAAECEARGGCDFPPANGLYLPQPYLCRHCGYGPRTHGYTTTLFADD